MKKLFIPQYVQDGVRAIRICLDGVQRLDLWGRADAQEAVHARAMVEQTLAEVFRSEFPELKLANGGLIAVSSEVDEGANEYGYNKIEGHPRAAVGAPNATDIPESTVSGGRELRDVQSIYTAFSYTTQDVRHFRMGGVMDIISEKGSNAREALDIQRDSLIAFGNQELGLHGFYNHVGLEVVSAATTAFTGDWNNSSRTGVEISDDFKLIVNQMMNGTEFVETPNTALFPTTVWNTLMDKLHNPTGGDRTVMDKLKSTYPMITKWDWEPKLNTAGKGGTPAVLVYNKDKRRQRVVRPMVARALPPERAGLTFKVVLEERFGGVVMPKPKAHVRADGV